MAVSFGTALASFVYEIAWVRMLSLVLGSATHSFELMLSAFILGLALGALWIRGRADRLDRPLVTLGATQWLMGLLALGTLPLYVASFQWTAGLVTGLPRTDAGYEVFSLARYGICLAVMLPATFCAGITLPLLTRALMKTGRGERAIGAIYGANTLGSIAGATLAGLVLMPVLGLKGLLAAGAALDVALGLALLAAADRDPARGGRRLLPVAAVAGAALLTTIVSTVRVDQLLLVSGVYRNGIILGPEETEVIDYRDGRTATVSVRRQPNGDVTLSTNGKPDASLNPTMFRVVPGRPLIDLTDDESTQLLLGVISLAHRADARRAAVVGQGSGFTSHVLLGSPALSRLVTIEIEPEMIAASRRFDPVNRRVFNDPRSVFAIEDARSYLASTAERFDLIVSEPSNPWVSGVSGLFTDEFYSRVRRALTPDGVLGQWLHLYSLEDDLALGVLAAIQRQFATYQIYLVSSTDILIVATNSPRQLTPDWNVVHFPGLAEDLAAVVPFTPTIFDAMRVTDRRALEPLVARTSPNSDYFPRLDLAAERTRFLEHTAGGLILLHYDRAAIGSERAPRVAPPASSEVPVPQVLRVRGLMWVALLHETLAGAPPRPQDSKALRDQLARAVERLQRIRAPLATGAAPPDWKAWLSDVGQAEDDLHRGTSGYADEGFFSAVERVAERPEAPPAVRATVAWLHALDRRDDAALLRLAEGMIELAARDDSGVPADAVLGAVVRVRLAAGDAAGARRAFERLRGRLRQPDDLRARLMAAHIEAAAR